MDLQKMPSPKARKTSRECTDRPESESPWKVPAANVTKGVRALHKRLAESLWTRSNSAKGDLVPADFKNKKQCSKTAAWAHENWWFELLL